MNKIFEIKAVANRQRRSLYLTGSGILSGLAGILKNHAPSEKYILITGKTAGYLFAGEIEGRLKNQAPDLRIITLPDGEDGKNMKILPDIVSEILSKPISRNTVIIALGGGAVTDTAGFIASILLRGIRCVFIPTTLLSMVDAAVGGKNGVNVTTGGKLLKNMAGTFYMPDLVISDIEVLKSLPAREMRSGLGEAVKYFCLFGKPEPHLEDLLELVHQCQKLKIGVVKKDPLDTLGLREMLNFGHTFGHALESVSRSKLSHGEAVSIGIAAACRLSVLLGLLPENRQKTVAVKLSALNLPLAATGLDGEEIFTSMAHDKKNGRFVLLKDIGQPVIKNGVPPKMIKKVIGEITS